MSLTVNNELGAVSISDNLIADIILKAMMSEDVKDLIWPATKRGMQIGLLPKLVDAELASNIITGSDDGVLTLEFNTIIKFGVSIKSVTSKVADLVHEETKRRAGISISRIVINISGVKSKKKAKRKTRVIYTYGS